MSEKTKENTPFYAFAMLFYGNLSVGLTANVVSSPPGADIKDIKVIVMPTHNIRCSFASQFKRKQAIRDGQQFIFIGF